MSSLATDLAVYAKSSSVAYATCTNFEAERYFVFCGVIKVRFTSNNAHGPK